MRTCALQPGKADSRRTWLCSLNIPSSNGVAFGACNRIRPMAQAAAARTRSSLSASRPVRSRTAPFAGGPIFSSEFAAEARTRPSVAIRRCLRANIISLPSPGHLCKSVRRVAAHLRIWVSQALQQARDFFNLFSKSWQGGSSSRRTLSFSSLRNTISAKVISFLCVLRAERQ